MQRLYQKLCASVPLALSLVLALVTLTSCQAVYTDPALTGIQEGYTNNWANVRTGTTTTSRVVTTYAPNMVVKIYQTVRGETVNGHANWYRISEISSEARYIHAGLVTISASEKKSEPDVKQIKIDLSDQWLYAYEGKRQVMDAPVATGQPELPTPTGTFEIMSKGTGLWFYSPWPAGSPYYYDPVQTNYAMLFADGGYYIHDAPWRAYFGPGADDWHHDDYLGWTIGSHGCVNLSTSDMEKIYEWTSIGTKVVVVS